MKLLNLFLLSAFFIGSVGFAQEDDVYKKFIKHSSIAIHKAQKGMIRAKKDEIGGLLAKAVILQNNALALYKANNNTHAVCASAVARKYAIEIIKNLNSKESEAYLIKEDEKYLINHCASDNELFNESKNYANNPSELDKDYITTLNNLSIDIK